MSYSNDVGRAANKAFSSPSSLASRRFSSRLSPRSRSSDGDSHSVAASRRSISMIQSEEDAEIFDQMNVTTTVKFKKPSRRHQIASSHSSVRSGGDSTAGGEAGSHVEEFVRGVNEVAQRFMHQLQVSASESFTQPSVVPKREAREIEEDDMKASNWSRRDSQDMDDDDDDDDLGASPRSIRDRSVATSQRMPLELQHNDNTFHVLASLVVEFMEARLTPNGKTIVLQPEDRAKLERVVPHSIRMDFIEAVRYRLERTPEHAATPIDFVTLQCQEMGLHRDGRHNAILVAANLGSNPALVQLVLPDTLSGSQTLSFHSQPSLSFNPTPVVYEDDEEENSASDGPQSKAPSLAEPIGEGSVEHQSVDGSRNDEDELDSPPNVEPDASADGDDGAVEECDAKDEEIEDVGVNQRYHQSMVSTMTTLDDGDKHADHEEDVELDGPAVASPDLPLLNENIVTQEAIHVETLRTPSGSTGNLTPMGVEMTFSEAESISQVRTSSKSKSGSLLEAPSHGTLSRQGSNNDEKASLAEEDAIETSKGVSVSIPTLDSPTVENSATEVLPARSEIGALSIVPPNTPAELHDTYAERVMSDEDTTLNEPTSPLPDALEAQVPALSHPLESAEEIDGENGTGRPPLAPNNEIGNDGDNYSSQPESTTNVSLRDDTQTVTSYFTDSFTMESLSTRFNINPFANLVALLSPSSATESRSTLQDDLEQKKKELARRAMQSGDYSVSDVIPRPVDATPSDSESLARQQLLAELREATALVEESEHPEITKFWEDHVMYLQFRLRALDGQDIYTSDEFATEIAESNRRLIEEIAHREQYISDDDLPATTERLRDLTENQVEGADATAIDRAVGTTSPAALLPDEVIASRSSFSSSHSAEGQTQVDPPAVLQPHHFDDSVPNAGQTDNGDYNGAAYVAMGENANPTATLHNVYTATSGHLPEPSYDLPMVDVVAPADLPGGYHFEAEIEGKRFLATVPQGGVQQGETFTCYMRDLDSVAIDIPVGHWRDNLSSLCDSGCCHPVVWNSLFCPLVVLSQIQHRVGFDFLGRPIMKGGSSSISDHLANRTVMLVILATWLLINLGIYTGYNWKWSRGLDLSVADISAIILVNVTMYGFVVFVTQSTRSSLREKFLIREQRCHDLEDIVLSTTCLPCTIGQMARHTANYDDYEAVCCSKTGLPDGVRVNELTKANGDYIV